MQISTELDHTKALSIYQAAGHPFPAIPAGANTRTEPFITTNGLPAVLVNQRGFSPIATDNEEQINGCMVLQAVDPAAKTNPELAISNLLDFLEALRKS